MNATELVMSYLIESREDFNKPLSPNINSDMYYRGYYICPPNKDGTKIFVFDISSNKYKDIATVASTEDAYRYIDKLLADEDIE